MSFVHRGKSSVSAYVHAAAPLLLMRVAAAFYLLLLAAARAVTPCPRSLAFGHDRLRPAAPTRVPAFAWPRPHACSRVASRPLLLLIVVAARCFFS